MIEFLQIWAESTWQVLVDSALYFLFGLILAGFVWLVLNERNLKRLLGRNNTSTVFRAALIGVPLPLCSCSVLPVARQLRESGLSRGGTVSFLISTPESSVDSILLTWSLTDPLLTVARPMAAFLTASVAGLWENRFEVEEPIPIFTTGGESACCDSDCGCESESSARNGHWYQQLGSGLRHSFTTLISDLAPYLLMGYILAGLAAAIFGSPLDLMGATAWWPYLLAIFIGVPLYICATSSTPLAAVLLGAGFPPGAILVFLMVGPATNMATLAVARKILGMGATIRYLVSIVVVSLVLGLVLDQAYGWFRMAPTYDPMAGDHAMHRIHFWSAIILAGLICYHAGLKTYRKLTSLR